MGGVDCVLQSSTVQRARKVRGAEIIFQLSGQSINRSLNKLIGHNILEMRLVYQALKSHVSRRPIVPLDCRWTVGSIAYRAARSFHPEH